MASINRTNDELLSKIKRIVEENLHDEHFGVSELATALGMSRSYLHRKVNAITKTSVSQLIRQIRLKKAKKLLRETSQTVSEVAYSVGFNSVTYFNKCFHDYYGYSPGQVGNRDEKEEDVSSSIPKKLTNKKNIIPAAVIILFVVISIWILTQKAGSQNNREKSIAVLIFEDSSAEEDEYVINRINDFVRSGLSAVNGLRVKPRRAVMKYKYELGTSYKQIVKDLGVDYILEGSGRTDNNIALTINLIDAKTGDVKWSKEFLEDREKVIAFQPILTKEIINAGLKITLTKEEKREIEKVITDNPDANDLYSMGLYELDLAQCNYMCNHQDTSLAKHLISAIDHFENALDKDSTISPAYAHLAKIYYYLGISKRTGKGKDPLLLYRDIIHENAQKAFRYDANSEVAQLAMAYSCMVENNREKALDHLYSAVDINSNSAEAIGRLVFIYGFGLRIPDEFVKCAMKNVKINNGVTEDKLTSATINYCTASALSRAAFFKKSEPYYDKTLEIFPNHVAAFVQKTFNMIHINPYEIDKALDYFETNYPHGDINTWGERQYFQNLGSLYYLKEDYEKAYKNFNIQLENYGEPGNVLAYYHSLKKLGKDEEAKKVYEIYHPKFENSDYYRSRDFNLSAWYCLTEDYENALKHLEMVAQDKDGIPAYSFIYRLYHSPMFENLRDDDTFGILRGKIEADFMAKRENVKEYVNDRYVEEKKKSPFKWFHELFASI